MIQCKVQPIKEYPFNVLEQPNKMMLSYLCLANEFTCRALQIYTHAYRVLKNDQQKQMVVLIILASMQNNQEQENIIQVPYNVKYFLNNSNQCKIYIKPYALQQNNLPDYQIASQLKLYSTYLQAYVKFIKQTLFQYQFIINSNTFIIDLLWLEDQFYKQTHLPNQIELVRKLNQNKFTKKHNYIQLFVDTNQLQIKPLIFKPNHTKFALLFSYDSHLYFIQTISLPVIYQKIFQSENYQSLILKLKNLNFFQINHYNQIVILKSQPQIGLSALIHHQCTKNGYELKNLNCLCYPSSGTFISDLKNHLSNLKPSIILVRNLNEIQKIIKYQSKLNLKLFLQRIQQIFNSSIQNNNYQNKLILLKHHQDIQPDMLKSCQYLQLNFNSSHKTKVFDYILSQFDSKLNHNDREILIGTFKNRGWTKFYSFIKQMKTREIQQFNPIMKQVEKIIHVEKAQNVDEVCWDDIGGLETAKQEIIQTVLLPIKHPEIFDQWIKPRTGLLFYGPPGTGKTLLGKCLAKECKMGFISVKGPQLLNMYIGQSEKNVRDLFLRAKASKPCIIFMDELDALIPKRGSSNDSSQVMDRIVAELLLQMDSASNNGIFIIGATNRPDLLDPSIIRPGRFDKQIYLGISTSKQDRIKILKAQTRKLKLQYNFNYQQIVQELPNNLTGADFYGITSKAAIIAVERSIQQYQLNGKSQEIIISQNDFRKIIPEIKPSVNQKELEHYQNLKNQFY